MLEQSSLDSIKNNLANIIQDTTLMIVNIPENDKDSQVVSSSLNHWAEVEYKGPHSGSVYICADQEFLKAVSINMLGLDNSENITLEQQTDAFKELANVITGQLITLVYGKDFVYTLSPPLYFKEPPPLTNNSLFYCFSYDCEGLILRVIFVSC
uniref:Chemotaxis protein CheX n=1 Tax=candidate division CPR3 bacterium TaxID=2268181 RepID=A0A7C5Z371_UNCC3